MILGLAETKQTDWSLMMAMMNPKLSVSRYRHRESGQIRLLSNEELGSLKDIDLWAPLGPISVATGIDAQSAERLFLARTIAEDMGQIQTFYQLENAPTPLVPSAADRWVERFAGFLASPFVAPWLLFAAMFFFSTEMSAPGLGLPGFLATVCFVLFFWSQALGGNADWLEVILFIVGVIFIGLELFVLPGFGVFGIGGLLMVIVSVVLASQSFLIPRTNEELAQIPYSLMPVVGAGFGVIAGAFALRKILPNSPYLRRMMLEPRHRVDTGLEGYRDPEAIVDWSHLADQTGETVTKLYPSGKAWIGGKIYDVISSGQMVDKGTRIVVIEARGNRVVVRPESHSE
jgi:membrane-bound ClpP family serine protease